MFHQYSNLENRDEVSIIIGTPTRRGTITITDTELPEYQCNEKTRFQSHKMKNWLYRVYKMISRLDGTSSRVYLKGGGTVVRILKQAAMGGGRARSVWIVLRNLIYNRLIAAQLYINENDARWTNTRIKHWVPKKSRLGRPHFGDVFFWKSNKKCDYRNK